MSDSRRGVLFAGDGGAPFPSAHPFGFQYFDFFEPTAKLRRATLAPTEMMRAARSSGASPPSADATTVLEVVPVLGSEPGSASGFLAQFANTLAWVQEGRAQALPLGRSIQIAVSAVSESRESVLVLVGDGSVFRTNKDSIVPLFRVPGESAGLVNDALGRGSDGEVAVLRFDSRVPTAAQPALAYRPGKVPLPLAPWSSAIPASAPACADGAGYRAIVTIDESWLELSSEAEPNDNGMTAAVRWSTDRVCVEAVEIGERDGMQGPPIGQRVVARFSPEPRAMRLATVNGDDLRQTLNCELLPPQ
ncbi:MAG TPA: hypothetical protein VER96_27020 [Polyangiaceae bacterium]|nr:hypothetical protein [Polyangiaceae bacterium]